MVNLVMLVSMGMMALVSLTISSSITTSVLAAEALLLDSMMTVEAALPSLSASTGTSTSDASASTSMGRVAARSRATSSCFSTLLTPTASTTCSTGSATFPRADFLVELWVAAASGELMLLFFFELFETGVVGDETLGELKLFLLELLVASLPGEL